LSGATYVGPVNDGLHRFLAVQDSGNHLFAIDVALNANGSLGSATAVSKTLLSPGFDFEGVVYNGPERNTVYVSEEDTPSVREYDLATGLQIDALPIPAVFANKRANFGFESLTKHASTGVLWTANEEALTVDGPISSLAAGTYVRLQSFIESGGSATAGAQYAYRVNPIHAGTSVDSNTRSGLSDLVALPDGTLLALERSLASAIPPFQSRIYQIDFTGATDVSVPPFDAGLIEQTFTPVGKTLLWSGQAGGGFGQNLEGLALGPQLANGNWSLLGVVDSGDPISNNTIVAFELIPPPCSLTGDYNCSGAVESADYLTWKSTFGAIGELPADGNGDGIVNAADYVVWRDHLGEAASGGAATVPEPAITAWGIFAFVAMLIGRKQIAAALG